MEQINRFLKRKIVKNILFDKIITNKHKENLINFFQNFPYNKLRDCDVTILSNFIKYDLENYYSRFETFKTTKLYTLESYKIKYGDVYGIILYQERNKNISIKKTKNKSILDKLNGYTYFKNNITEELSEDIIKDVEDFHNQIKINSDTIIPLTDFIKYKRTNFTLLYNTLRKMPKVSLDSFILRYGELAGIDKFNEFKNKSKKSLTNTNQYWQNLGYSEEETKSKISEIQTLRANIIGDIRRGMTDIFPSQIQYWTKQGYTTEEAEELVTTNQRTFTKEKCIQKYGEEKGIQVWQDRQSKWMSSMKKSSMILGVSAISMELFNEVAKAHPNILYGKNEKEIKVNGKVYWLDCILETNMRVIEFYGDYWHGNPNLFEDDKIIKKGNKTYTSLEIRSIDDIRISNIKEKGYDVLVIWENDYRTNKSEVIQRCIDYLK